MPRSLRSLGIDISLDTEKQNFSNLHAFKYPKYSFDAASNTTSASHLVPQLLLATEAHKASLARSVLFRLSHEAPDAAEVGARFAEEGAALRKDEKPINGHIKKSKCFYETCLCFIYFLCFLNFYVILTETFYV